MPSLIMLAKIRNHLYLALVFYVLSLGQQYSFYAFKGLPIVWLTLGKYLGVFLFFLFFTFAPGKYTRFILLSFLMILNFFQMGHLSYFGTQVLPNEIFLFFHEFGEIGGTMQAELSHTLVPLLFTIVPMGIGFFFLRKLPTFTSFKLVPIITILYFFYNPVRTYITGNTWGRQPSTRELSGMNLYLSLSYCVGRIVPHKLQGKGYIIAENESLKLKLEKSDPSQWDNIVLILGESLSPHHMSLFGYSQPTTTYLESLKDQKNFLSLVGLSSGVSTDISVAFFLNMGYGDAGGMKASKGEHCLFKLAKQTGFSTHFLSTQSAEQLRYIAPYLCIASLDDYRSLENISPATVDAQAAIDADVLPKLDDLLKTPQKKFIMLHQRGSHAPWARRYRPEVAKFKPEGEDARISDYNNSVVEFDLFWKGLNEVVAKHKSKTLVIYLSDHGESVGMNNRYGHGFLLPSSFEIPVIFQAFNAELPDRSLELPKFIPQYNLALFIANQIGWKTNQDSHSIMKDYMIYGNDIDGFAGKAQIHFNEQGNYSFKVIP